MFRHMSFLSRYQPVTPRTDPIWKMFRARAPDAPGWNSPKRPDRNLLTQANRFTPGTQIWGLADGVTVEGEG